jgi:hypothetical protein
MKLPAPFSRLSLKKVSVFILSVFVLLLIVSKGTRRSMFSYFSTRCIDYHQKDFSRKLSDKLITYSAAAKSRGVRACRDDNEVKTRIAEGKLVKVRSNGKYEIDRLSYSVPCLTGDGKELLDEIADRFREKTSQKGLKRARLIITSLTRKTDDLRDLRRNNSNASANSPHLYGNAFDISYKRFTAHKMRLTNCDVKFMKEALAQVIWELRKERRCWATYETNQGCFHVVSR